jgi:hypothetical protein
VSETGSIENPLRWWWAFGLEPEHYAGDYDTRDEAFAAAMAEANRDDDSYITLAYGRRMSLCDDIFDGEVVIENWLDANVDFSDEGGDVLMDPTADQSKELVAALNATFASWRKRHNLGRAYTIDVSSEEIIAINRVKRGFAI